MSKTTVAAETEKAEGEVQITELASIEPTRVDGVGTPANGFPILMMKSIAPEPVTAEKAAAGTSCGCGPDCACASKPKKAKKEKAKKAKAAGGEAAKSATMPEGGSSNESSTQAAAITSDVIAKAVAEATAPIEAELKTLRKRLAKVLATPIPGGPQLVTPPIPARENPAVSKAAEYRAIANKATLPAVRDAYTALAEKEEQGAPITKE